VADIAEVFVRAHKSGVDKMVIKGLPIGRSLLSFIRTHVWGYGG